MIKILMPLEIDFLRILVDLGRQNGAKLAPKSHQKSIPTSKGDYNKKNIVKLMENSRMAELPKMEPSWHQNRIKNRSYLKSYLQSSERLKTIVKPLIFNEF